MPDRTGKLKDPDNYYWEWDVGLTCGVIVSFILGQEPEECLIDRLLKIFTHLWFTEKCSLNNARNCFFIC